MEPLPASTKPSSIQISSKKEPRAYINYAKSALGTSSTIELHALGEAITTCAKVGEMLFRNGYAVITKIQTSTLPPSQDPNLALGVQRKKAKMVVILERSADFFKKIAEEQAKLTERAQQ